MSRLFKVAARGSCAPHVVYTRTHHIALRAGAASHDRPVCLCYTQLAKGIPKQVVTRAVIWTTRATLFKVREAN